MSEPETIAALRDVLDAHANVAATGRCRLCAVVTCTTWRATYDRLADAGHLMATPDRWERPSWR
jgi:hypothetical protein